MSSRSMTSIVVLEQPAARIDQQHHTAQVSAARANRRRRALVQRARSALRDARVAVARKIGQHQPGPRREEIDLPRAARRVRDARERLSPRERVDETRLADIGAAGEGDLGRPRSRGCRSSVMRRARARRFAQQPAASYRALESAPCCCDSGPSSLGLRVTESGRTASPAWWFCPAGRDEQINRVGRPAFPALAASEPRAHAAQTVEEIDRRSGAIA